MKKAQEQVRLIRKHNNWKTDPKYILLAMQEELGELVASYLAYHTDEYRKNSETAPHKLDEEFGDLLHLLLAFANEMEIDCEKSLENTNEKIKK